MPSSLEKSAKVTPKGTRYALIEGPEIEYNNHGDASLNATYQTNVADVSAFVNELMPSPVQIPNSSRVVLDPTLKISNYPGSPAVFSPIKAVVTGFSDDLPTDWFAFDSRAPIKTYNLFARIAVTFTVNLDSFFTLQRSNANPIELLEPAFSTSAEVISYKVDKNFRASSDQTSGAEGKSTIKDFTAPTVAVIPISERSYRWNWALNPDFNTIFTLIGRLNSAALTWMDYSPAQTVMFMGVSGKREYRWAQGGRNRIAPWSLEYKFAQRSGLVLNQDRLLTPLTWNHFFNPDTGTFQFLSRNVFGSTTVYESLYATGEFDNLFLAKVG